MSETAIQGGGKQARRMNGEIRGEGGEGGVNEGNRDYEKSESDIIMYGIMMIYDMM